MNVRKIRASDTGGTMTVMTNSRPDTMPPGPALAAVEAVAVALGELDAAHRRLRSHLAHRLGLTVTDLTALVIVASEQETTPKRLAAEMGLSTGAVTTLIDRLTSAKQVTRAPREGDRRSLLIELTTNGQQTIETVWNVYLTAIATALSRTTEISNDIAETLQQTAGALDEAARPASR